MYLSRMTSSAVDIVLESSANGLEEKIIIHNFRFSQLVKILFDDIGVIAKPIQNFATKILTAT